MTSPGPPPAPARVGDATIRADVVIVGAGVAGLMTALRLPEDLEVVVVDKGPPEGDSGSSPWAQGGLAAAIGPDDSPALHAEDTLLASDGLCDPAAVDVLAQQTPDRVAELLRLGARFDRLPGAEEDDGVRGLALAREGGQRVGRSVKRADATGAELVRVLRGGVRDRVSRLAGVVVRLARDGDGRVTGLWVLAGGELLAVEARAVVLATGGCGGLFAATTNPETATGDGIALAATVGAAVRDLEFVQFHPTGLAVSGTWRFLLTEALRGAGATLHDTAGERFMVGRHPDAELAPRHVVANAILELDGGMAYLDATHLGEETFAREFPTVLAGARAHGFDLAGERVPVTPAAHYQVGGVRTDLWGRTSLAGLYAAGEVASTGVHGANRMASNSLSEALVFGARTADALVADLSPHHGEVGASPLLEEDQPETAAARVALRRRLRERMLELAGPVRDAEGLRTIAADLDTWRDQLGPPRRVSDSVELDLALSAAGLIVRNATLRTESRGGHRRSDHPERHASWKDVHLESVSTRPIT